MVEARAREHPRVRLAKDGAIEVESLARLRLPGHPMLHLDAKAQVDPASASLSVDAIASPASLRVSAMSAVSSAVTAVLLDPTKFEVYEHHGQYEEPEVAKRVARRHLEQLRSRVRVACRQEQLPAARARGALSPRWSPARRARSRLRRHEGDPPRSPSRVPRPEGPQARALHERLRVHPRQRGLPTQPAATKLLQQVLESAVVVGPKGEEIYTDEYGRIKVQFHWDRLGKNDEFSTCWIRVSQAWAGTAWGFQYIPRIGMEVLVSFIGGDEDRPMVVGCVYNQTHPVPFKLPISKTMSGIRTQSSPGGGGYNELSFEDLAGSELVYLHAQRDLSELVQRDHREQIGRDEHVSIGGSKQQHIKGDRSDSVGGTDTRGVGGKQVLQIAGDQEVNVRGDVRETVARRVSRSGSRARTTPIRVTTLISVHGNQTLNVGTPVKAVLLRRQRGGQAVPPLDGRDDPGVGRIHHLRRG